MNSKMPEMPEAAYFLMGGFYYATDAVPHGVFNPKPVYTADQMQAMYLAGIEAAKACVPKRMRKIDGISVGWNVGFNNCRNLTLSNLTALEQEAGSADKADGRYTPEIRAAINKLSPKG